MPRLAVVFDTNIYRGTTTEEWDALRDREASHSVLGYTSPAVITELFSHLGDPESGEKGPAIAAIRRLCRHCTEFNGWQYRVRFVAPAMGQMCHTLFGVDIDDPEEPAVLGHLAGRIANEEGAVKALAPSLRIIFDGTQAARTSYVDTLWTSVVLTLSPGATQWSDVTKPSERRTALLEGLANGADLRILSSSIAEQAATYAKVSIPLPEDSEAPSRVLKYYPTVVHYRSLVIKRLVQNGPDMTKRSRANGAMDIHVCTSTGPTAILNGVPLILITSDTDILDAAVLSGMRHRILNPLEYKELLALAPDEFSERTEGWLAASRTAGAS